MAVKDGNKTGIEVKLDEQSAEVFVGNKKIGVISFKTNPYHIRHCYLDLDFEVYDLVDAKLIVDTLTEKIKKPLQVMISSNEIDTISFLKTAGFSGKRKCYEVEANQQHYIGRNIDGPLLLSHVGEDIYRKCCNLMLDRYISTHDAINPWTGTKEDFYNNLPDKVFCNLANGNMKL